MPKITHTYFFLLWSVVLGNIFGDICLEYNEMEIAYLSKHCFELFLIGSIFFLLTTSTRQKLSCPHLYFHPILLLLP